jgi:hypothetical protein
LSRPPGLDPTLLALHRGCTPRHLLLLKPDDSRMPRPRSGRCFARCPSRHRRHRPPARLLLARCFATRRLDLEMNTALHGRAIATARFRSIAAACRGVPKIRPTELLPVGGTVTLAFLWYSRCIWEIDQANSISRHGREAAGAIAVQAVVVVSSGTSTVPLGGRAG